MADDIRLTVSKGNTPAIFGGCLAHLISGVMLQDIGGALIYGYDAQATTNDGAATLESRWQYDDTPGNTVYQVFQGVMPFQQGGPPPLGWVAASGALNQQFWGVYDATSPIPLTKDDMMTAAGEMWDLYVQALVVDMLAATYVANTDQHRDSGFWGDFTSVLSGLAVLGGEQHPVLGAFQGWDREQENWAGTGLYFPNIGAAGMMPAPNRSLERMAIALDEIGMSRLDVSINNGNQMYSVVGGTRVG